MRRAAAARRARRPRRAIDGVARAAARATVLVALVAFGAPARAAPAAPATSPTPAELPARPAPAALPEPSGPATSGEPVPRADAVVRWAGHQIVTGEQQAPVLGAIRTRTESFLLASAKRTATGWAIEQRACRVEIADVAGASVKMARPVELLPAARFTLEAKGAGLEAGWFALWGREDVDGDGRPGATVIVDAPLCGGTLEVASRTGSFATARPDGEGLTGTIRVRVEQWILGTDGACLGLVAKDTDERMAGTFAYAPVADGASCASLAAAPWPVRAREP